jgi:anti-sigma B factor antagonist
VWRCARSEALSSSTYEAKSTTSTGIALIVGLLARARISKRRLVAYGLSDHYVEVFNITRLSDLMSVFPDEERAISQTSVS